MKAVDSNVAATSSAIYLCIRSLLAAAAILLVIGCSQRAPPVTSTVTATFDQSGHHPGSVQVTGPATVTCTDGVGGQGNPVDCLVVSPGYVGEIKLHQSGKTTGAGTVLLTCSGQGRCSASVVQ